MVDILFLCNEKKCDELACTGDFCRHTRDINYAVHKDHLEDCLFKPLQDGLGNVIAFIEVEC